LKRRSGLLPLLARAVFPRLRRRGPIEASNVGAP